MSSCYVTIGADVVELGSEINMRTRFATASTPTATQIGYGTIAAANTYETVSRGQVAGSLVDMIYFRAVDYDIYVGIDEDVGRLKVPAGETSLFKPLLSTGAVASVRITSETAGAKFEYLVVGKSS